MTAIAALTLANGETTPVNKTFDPVTIKNEVAQWAERSTGIALGFPIVTFSMRAPANAKGARNYRMVAKVVVPVLEVTSASTGTGIQPAPTKAYDMIANVEMVLPERSTQQQRKDIAAFARNFLGSAVVTAAIANFETVSETNSIARN